MMAKVRDLKKSNRKAINKIKNFKPACHTIHNKAYYNLFFQSLIKEIP